MSNYEDIPSEPNEHLVTWHDRPYSELPDLDQRISHMIGANRADWTETDLSAWPHREESQRYNTFLIGAVPNYVQAQPAQVAGTNAPRQYTPEEVASWLEPEPRGLRLALEIAGMMLSDAVDTLGFAIYGNSPYVNDHPFLRRNRPELNQ